MNALELCNAFVASLRKTPGSKPLRTFVDDDGNFTIEEDADDDAVERSTGYVGPGGRRESDATVRWRQLVLGAMATEALAEE